MLVKLVIKNVALIESAEIEFTKGFNVLSGETGSGKSVILESINFVLGAKADKTLIRSGSEQCSVSAEFELENSDAIFPILDDFGFERDKTLIITRKLSAAGKNTVTINGNPAAVSMVKKLTSVLIDVHGQSEHFYLLNTSNQLKLLDKFSGSKYYELSDKIRVLYEEYKRLTKELCAAGGDETSRLLRADVLNYQIREIESADIKENEFEELTAIKEKLVHREKIAAALNAVKSGIEDESGVSDILTENVRYLNGIAAFGEEYAELAERLNGVYAEIDDILSSVGNFLENLGYGEYDPEEIDNRLGSIKNLFKKYGGDYNALREFYNNAVKEKEKLDNFNEYAEHLQNDILAARKELYALYSELSAVRRKFADKFSGNVIAELKELGMAKAKFSVEFNEIPSFEECRFDSANGFDSVCFAFSANAGEPPKPLSEVISGGEMSRFMLAVKAQTAKFNDISTFIFDEIDAGISGAIAWIVAEKLVNIAVSVQVIAVSHLPQIVSFADNNILITKKESDDKTVTSVKSLDASGKEAEIIRLSGGTSDSVSSVEHAKTLIKKAEYFKNNLK